MREAELIKISVEEERRVGYVRPANDIRAAKNLVSQGWQKTWAALFGANFLDALASHHAEAVEWHWNSRLAYLTNERPEYKAYFPIWPRGQMKSSIAERMVVVDAIMSVAYGKPGYCLYLSKNKDKVQEHIANIERLMALPSVRLICPGLSTPQRTEITNQQRRWTSSFLKTSVNYSIQGGTLDSGLAGSRVDETRVTMLMLDDIDGREDSPVIAESRYRQLTTEILPMGQGDTLIFFAQNLISRFSVMYRIQKGHVNVLTNRKPTEPVPAVINMVTEQRTVNGIVKDVFVSGIITWHVWDKNRVQDEIDTEGLEAFRRELQHEVEESREDRIFYNYRDDIHAISESEFASVYGSLDAWLTWRKKPGNDWARTKTDKHANVAGWLTVSDEGTEFPGATFIRHALSFPANTAPEDVAEKLIDCLDPFAYDNVTWSQLRKTTLRRLNADTFTTTVAERLAYEHGELSKIIPRYTRPLFDRCNVFQGDMSHEREDVRHIYRTVYGLAMKGVNPKKHGGVEIINRDMRVDDEVEHPFRPGEMGYTRWFVVVPDGEEAYRKDSQGRNVYRPKPYSYAVRSDDLTDTDLFRFQMSNYRHRPAVLTAAGETIDDPEKMYDDFPQWLQMAAVGSTLTAKTLTIEQKVKAIMPKDTERLLKEAKTADEKLTAGLNYESQRAFAEEILGVVKDEYEDFE